MLDFVWGEGKHICLVTTFTTVTTVTTVTTLTIVTTVNTVTTVTTVTTIIVKYQMLFLYSSKGNFSETSYNGMTNQHTTRLLELLRAAKKWPYQFWMHLLRNMFFLDYP